MPYASRKHISGADYCYLCLEIVVETFSNMIDGHPQIR
jgi:hypothetical protein